MELKEKDGDATPKNTIGQKIFYLVMGTIFVLCLLLLLLIIFAWYIVATEGNTTTTASSTATTSSDLDYEILGIDDLSYDNVKRYRMHVEIPTPAT